MPCMWENNRNSELTLLQRAWSTAVCQEAIVRPLVWHKWKPPSRTLVSLWSNERTRLARSLACDGQWCDTVCTRWGFGAKGLRGEYGNITKETEWISPFWSSLYFGNICYCFNGWIQSSPNLCEHHGCDAGHCMSHQMIPVACNVTDALFSFVLYCLYVWDIQRQQEGECVYVCVWLDSMCPQSPSAMGFRAAVTGLTSDLWMFYSQGTSQGAAFASADWYFFLDCIIDEVHNKQCCILPYTLLFVYCTTKVRWDCWYKALQCISGPAECFFFMCCGDNNENNTFFWHRKTKLLPSVHFLSHSIV